MDRSIAIVYVLVMVALVVGVDVLLLRHLFWPRLISNIVIVAAFLGVYMVALRHP